MKKKKKKNDSENLLLLKFLLFLKIFQKIITFNLVTDIGLIKFNFQFSYLLIFTGTPLS